MADDFLAAFESELASVDKKLNQTMAKSYKVAREDTKREIDGEKKTLRKERQAEDKKEKAKMLEEIENEGRDIEQVRRLEMTQEEADYLLKKKRKRVRHKIDGTLLVWLCGIKYCCYLVLLLILGYWYIGLRALLFSIVVFVVCCVVFVC